VFRPALGALGIRESYPELNLHYLPSRLHSRPHELQDLLLEEINWARGKSDEVICLYGECCPDLFHQCKRVGAHKVPGAHCYEILLGGEQYREIMEQGAGVYFIERDLIENFKEYCIDPLELYDDDIRKLYFKHYHTLLYIRQPSDGNLIERIRDLANFLDLKTEIRDADYTHLSNMLKKLLGPGRYGH
jgi:hypothetical protein